MADGDEVKAIETKVEQTNQLLRAYVVGVLVTGFAAVFVWGQLTGRAIISTDAYVGILAMAMIWLFKSRDEERAQRAVVEATKVAVATTTNSIKNGEANATKPSGN